VREHDTDRDKPCPYSFVIPALNFFLNRECSGRFAASSAEEDQRAGYSVGSNFGAEEGGAF
jgi:hypothetical protein